MSFASNHEPKFLADDVGVIAELPTQRLEIVTLASCWDVPMIRNSVLSFQHPITNIINTAFHSSLSNLLVNTSIGAEGQIKLAVICITMNARQMFVHDLKNLARIQYNQ